MIPGSATSGRFWAASLEDLAGALDVALPPAGLSGSSAAARLAAHGPNEIREHVAVTRWRVIVAQLRSPLLLLLLFAAGASLVTRQWTDAVIVLVIVAASAAIGATREYGAQHAAERLRARVRATTRVVRDGVATDLPSRELVPGDVVLLSAGSLVPADAVLLEATDLFVNESVLTGESFPVEKQVGPVAPDAPVARRTGCVFQGTDVRGGAARALVAATGRATLLGAVAHRLAARPPETEFDRGIRRFGYLLLSAMTMLVLAVFAVNVILGRDPIETLLFAVALAVGLSPELLPAILSTNLARAARMMASHGVLVRRLPAIENLGSMDVLCTDKTGTLTEGVVRLDDALDPEGRPDPEVLDLAAVNAALQAGLANPLDRAILDAHPPPAGRWQRLGEVPYDFSRKRLSVIAAAGSSAPRLITKGAVPQVLAACTTDATGATVDPARRAELQQRVHAITSRGIRVLAVADRAIEPRASYRRADERDLRLVGFVCFRDRVKDDAADTVAHLATLGVTVKLISGDAAPVAAHVATAVGLRSHHVLTGADIDHLRPEGLWRAVQDTDVFAEVDPNQKERIVRALRSAGHVVGFLGDGINDAPAMHAADTAISVDTAVDVAREAADFVLLERDLDVIRRGLEEGRRTFANTLKYILTTTSANLGNMVSMAAASLLLPFLPLLPGQILLNNFLSDVPAVGLAADRVDPELVDRPRRWNMRFIARFMIEFGVLSSLFDVVTFAVLLSWFRAAPALFRTGWFVESLLTELLVALVVRNPAPGVQEPAGPPAGDPDRRRVRGRVPGPARARRRSARLRSPTCRTHRHPGGGGDALRDRGRADQALVLPPARLDRGRRRACGAAGRTAPGLSGRPRGTGRRWWRADRRRAPPRCRRGRGRPAGARRRCAPAGPAG